jgi:hypothetical protein
MNLSIFGLKKGGVTFIETAATIKVSLGRNQKVRRIED